MLFYLYEREYYQHMPAVVFACTLGTVEDVETYLVCSRGGEITADCGNDFQTHSRQLFTNLYLR